MKKNEIENNDYRFSLLNATLNAIDEGVLVIDLNGKVVFHNPKFLDIWSLPKKNLNDKTSKEIIEIATRIREKEEDSFNQIENSNINKKHEYKDVMNLKDGKIIERYSRPEIINGEMVGRVWTYKDITEIISTEKQLFREKDLLQALMDNIPDMIYFKDIKSRFIRINKAEAGLLGIENPKDAIGKTDFDFFEFDHAKAAFEDEQRIIQSKNKLISKAERIMRAGKDYIWLTATKVPILDNNNNVIGIVGISRDITASKLNEEKLRKYSEELNELNQGKDKFFSILAHDLRSPLSPLLGLSEILTREFDTLSYEEIKEFSKDIHEAIKSQFNLLENLLSWSRMQTGKMVCKPVELKIYEKINSVITLLKGNARDKKISVQNKINPDLVVYADSVMLHSILQNLISNAIKFTHQEGEIEILSKENGSSAEIIVKDNGIGIKEENIINIFGLNCFTTYGTKNEKGTGLGLLICKEMVERNGGKIRVESEYQKGSKFIFSLPKTIFLNV